MPELLARLQPGENVAHFEYNGSRFTLSADGCVYLVEESSAIDVLREFIGDVESVGYETAREDWYDISETYLRAKTALGEQFDETA